MQSSIKNELACEKLLIQGLDKIGRPILIVQVCEDGCCVLKVLFVCL